MDLKSQDGVTLGMLFVSSVSLSLTPGLSLPRVALQGKLVDIHPGSLGGHNHKQTHWEQLSSCNPK